MGEALTSAAADAGIRITLLDALYLHGGLTDAGYSEPEVAQRRFSDRTVGAWIERVAALDATDTRRVGVAIHSVRAVDPDAIGTVARWADDTGAVLHAHVSEQPAENEACLALHGRTPTGVLQDAGALSAKFTAVHATHAEDADIAALAAARSTVAMCPTTERDLGDGIGPTRAFAAAGVSMALGSDSHAVIDLFEEGRALELDERLRSQQRGVHAANHLLDMATVAGHRCLGWDDAGAIAVGHRADLVSVSLGSVRTAGARDADAIEATVFAASARDVTDVVVDGRRIVTAGRHVDIDVAAELRAAITELMDR
jgi:formiminoglutamate deiminase